MYLILKFCICCYCLQYAKVIKQYFGDERGSPFLEFSKKENVFHLPKMTNEETSKRLIFKKLVLSIKKDLLTAKNPH